MHLTTDRGQASTVPRLAYGFPSHVHPLFLYPPDPSSDALTLILNTPHSRFLCKTVLPEADERRRPSREKSPLILEFSTSPDPTSR